MAVKTERYTVRLTAATATGLKQVATEDQTNLSHVIRAALDEYLSERRPMEEAFR